MLPTPKDNNIPFQIALHLSFLSSQSTRFLCFGIYPFSVKTGQENQIYFRIICFAKTPLILSDISTSLDDHSREMQFILWENSGF